MAWQDTFLDASYRGVKFQVLSVTRSGQRAIAQNEYPYTDGADLDDLGLGPRRMALKAIVWGDDYQVDLAQLISALEAPGPAELVHPIHGAMQALPESWDDEHEPDLANGAIVSIAFIEHTLRVPVFTAVSQAAKADAITTHTQAAVEAADEALVRYVQLGMPTFTVPRITVLKDAFNQAKAALTQLLDTTALRATLSDLDPLLYPLAYATDLLAVVDRALQGLPFGLRNLVFDESSGALAVAGSGLGDFTTARKLLDPATVVLAASVATPSVGMLVDLAVVQAHARAHAACAVANCAAIVLAAELDAPLLDRADIEALANSTRAGLQLAMDGARAALDGEGRGRTSQALRDVAYAVQEAAVAVINQRPPLVQRASPIAGPVRLVAHQLYGDASRAGEVARLNALGRRVLIERGEVLNVYSA